MTPENKTMHTKEPWVIDPVHPWSVDGFTMPEIMMGMTDDDATDMANAARAVACVNKLAGIPDLTTAEVVPGEVMALVREALEDIVNDATTNPLTRGDRAYSIAKQALAALTRME